MRAHTAQAGNTARTPLWCGSSTVRMHTATADTHTAHEVAGETVATQAGGAAVAGIVATSYTAAPQSGRVTTTDESAQASLAAMLAARRAARNKRRRL